MTYEAYIEEALSLAGASADHPFADDPVSTVLRHGASGKWFALLMRVSPAKIGCTGDAPIWIVNLKTDPEAGFAVRDAFPAIRPAYHMNKLHWLSLPLEADLPTDLIRHLTLCSYRLTAPRRRP